jgi:hypothetical protein
LKGDAQSNVAYCRKFPPLLAPIREQPDTRLRFLNEGKTKESVMPVLLWAVPAVIFVGGVGYFLVRAVH